jgi:hypothetical protein
MVLNGKERSIEEWSGVITAADAKLKLNRVISPLGGHFSAIEVLYEG